MAYTTKAWNVCKKLAISYNAMHNEYIASSVDVTSAAQVPTLGSGGKRALLRRYMLPMFIWMLVLVKRSS